MLRLLGTIILTSLLSLSAHAQVIGHQKISDNEGNFAGALADYDYFGHDPVSLGDLDGDRIPELAVGAYRDDDGGNGRGAIWILYLNEEGQVKFHRKISDETGGFEGVLDDKDGFGSGLAALGDLDGDGVGDIVTGARHDDDGGIDRGAIWVLFLNQDGTVKSHQKISSTAGGFNGVLDDGDEFGVSISALGDLNGDGNTDIAVDSRLDDDGGIDRGAVWILFLNSDGTVQSHQKISSQSGGFTGVLDDGDEFGTRHGSLGDLNGDGITDLAVASRLDDDGGLDRGAVWILFLNTDGTIKSHQKISSTEGGFTGTLDDEDYFGNSVGVISDFNSDGIVDIMVGAGGDDDGGLDRGAVWILHLDTDGTVKSHQKISDTDGGFEGNLRDADNLGQVGTTVMGDVNGDGFLDIAVGTQNDDDGGINRGAVWIMFTDIRVEPAINVTIELHLEPQFNPVPPQGGDFFYTMRAINHANRRQALDVWFVLTGADRFEKVIHATDNLTLEANQVVVKRPPISIPASAPATNYRIIAYWAALGTFPADTLGSAMIRFSKESGDEIIAGSHTIGSAEFEAIPTATTLISNYPNPFNPSTTISYSLAQREQVSLAIYNVLGQEVRSLVGQVQGAGFYAVRWDGRNNAGHELPGGIYIYRLQAGEFTDVKKMTLTK